MARETERVDALIEIGIDSPLKLDLVATIEQGAGGYGRADSLAAVCGVSHRDATPTLEALADRRLIDRRRFYNITEYASTTADDVRERLRGLLLGTGPAEMRRLRRALLVRQSSPGAAISSDVRPAGSSLSATS